jgi:hypothetical protein
MQILDDIVSSHLEYILQILGSNWYFILTQILLNDDFRFVLSEDEYYVYLHLIYDSDLWLNIS